MEPAHQLDPGSLKHPRLRLGRHGPRARHSDFDFPGACVGGVSFEEVAMEVLYPRCAGLDVYKDTVVAAVRLTEDDGSIRREV